MYNLKHLINQLHKLKNNTMINFYLRIIYSYPPYIKLL